MEIKTPVRRFLRNQFPFCQSASNNRVLCLMEVGVEGHTWRDYTWDYSGITPGSGLLVGLGDHLRPGIESGLAMYQVNILLCCLFFISVDTGRAQN